MHRSRPTSRPPITLATRSASMCRRTPNSVPGPIRSPASRAVTWSGTEVSVPNSGKGRNRHKSTSGATAVPLTADLASRFAALAAGRPEDDLLLTDPNGQSWTVTDLARRLFRKIAGKTTMIAFRHSSIVRALRANVPIKTVADWHNTSVRMIESNYARYMRNTHHDLIRPALLETGPGTNVIPMRA